MLRMLIAVIILMLLAAAYLSSGDPPPAHRRSIAPGRTVGIPGTVWLGGGGFLRLPPPFPSDGPGPQRHAWVMAAATAACLARQPTRPARPSRPATGRTTAPERSLTAAASVAAVVRPSPVVWHAVGI